MLIDIPKVKVLELIKKDNCSFYDYINYVSLEINVTENDTKLTEFENSNKLDLSFKDLSSLLFDRVIKVQSVYELVISVS
jgi:hypothetical protein